MSVYFSSYSSLAVALTYIELQSHGTDLLNAFAPGDMTDYFLRFVRHLDPNSNSGVQWPRFDNSSRLTLQFNDGSTPISVTADTARLAATRALFDLGRFTWRDD